MDQYPLVNNIVNKLLFCIVMCTSGIAQDLIAVVDFSSNNMSYSDVLALTNRLRNEIYKTGVFSIIERDLMEEILIEQSFQQTGCTSNECLVEIGKLVSVNKIVGGSISKIGNIYTISARIVDVESGVVTTVCDYDHTGVIDDLLTDGMKQVAIELVGIEPKKKTGIIYEVFKNIFSKILINNRSVQSNVRKTLYNIDEDVPYDVYKVSAFGTNLRVGPDTSYSVIRNLYLGDALLLIDAYDDNWYEVSYFHDIGFVYKEHIEIDTTENYKDYFGWTNRVRHTGEIFDCIDIKWRSDQSLDNFIRIQVGNNTNVIIKLIEYPSQNCTRAAYIATNEEYYLRHIPLGNYKLKIAYGYELMSRNLETDCELRFIRDTHFEITNELLVFSVEKEVVDDLGLLYTKNKLKSYNFYINMISHQTVSNIVSNKMTYRDFRK